MALHGKTHERRKEALRTLTDFGSDRDSIRGRRLSTPVPGARFPCGRLPEAERDRFRSSMLRYVVMSYATPIAWVTVSGEIVIPDVKYSVTTTNHQTACRVYLSEATQPEHKEA